MLVFTHRLSEANGGRLAAARDAAGWDQCLAALEASLGGEQAAEQPMLPAIEAYVDRFGLGDGQVEDTADGRVLHFERDIVWQPPEQAWQVLVGSSGYLEPGAPVPASAAPAGGVVTHVESPRVLEYAAGDGRVRWEFTADAKLGHRVSLTQVVPAQRTDAVPELLAGWKAHLEGFFARLMGG